MCRFLTWKGASHHCHALFMLPVPWVAVECIKKVKVRRDMWRLPLHKVWWIRAGCCVQPGFEYPWGLRLYSLSGQPVPVYSKKSVSLCLNGICCVSICVHCLFAFPWMPLRRTCLCLLHSSHQVFKCTDNILPWTLCSPGWRVPTTSGSPCMLDSPIH